MKFNRITQGGMITCRICGKLTRDTGHDEADLELCRKCIADCHVENAEADYGTDSPEHKRALVRRAEPD